MPSLENPAGTAGRRPRRTRRSCAAVIAVAALCLCAGAAPASAARKRAKAYTVNATSGAITVTFSPAVWAALNSSTGTSSGRNVTPLAPATVPSPGTLRFPVARGSLNSLTGRGSVSASGGLAIESHLSFGGLLTSSAASSVMSPVASLGASSNVTVDAPNMIPPRSVALFRLNTFHMRVAGGRHAVSLSKIPVRLAAAGALFLGPGFSLGQEIGTITIQIKG